MQGKPVFRFAPSPNGELHLGHAYSAIVGFEMAQRLGGRFLVRIEDIDLGRCREEFVSAIYEDLRWLGLTWEEPVLRQSKHFDDYRAAAQKLEALGLLYPCFASRNEIAIASENQQLGSDPDGSPLYPYLHKGLASDVFEARKNAGEPFATRIDMERAIAFAHKRLDGRPLTFTETGSGIPTTIEARPERWGDAIIIRKDIPSSYALAVVTDDAGQGVTHVTRGRDLYDATDLQRLLQVLLGFPEPIYHHHRLIEDGTGRKLSKSERDTSIRRLRAAGATPLDIRVMVGCA